MKTHDVFKALSDPTRREILKRLKRGSMNAGQLADLFPMTKGSVSHHFNLLKQAELVRCERRGKEIVYALNTSVFEEVAAALLGFFTVARRGRNETVDRARHRARNNRALVSASRGIL